MSVFSSPAPSELGGYVITREFRPDHSYLALAPGGRQVVLKVLENDVLLADQLHPNIRDRLGRICELAHRSVANLHGVERDQGKIYAVWEYVEGRTLQDFAASENTNTRQLLLVFRELLLTMQSLHSMGIVHGSIHARNVMIDDNGNIALIHFSPLLHYDPAVDEAAALAMLREIASMRRDGNSTLLKEIDSITSFKNLSASLATESDARDSVSAARSQPEERSSSRMRAVVAAIMVALLGALLSAGGYWFVKRSQPALPQPLRPSSTSTDAAKFA